MVQRTLAAFDARPHWGKMHWLGARELAQLYPRFRTSRGARAVDPDGVLMTPYLPHLLGLTAPGSPPSGERSCGAGRLAWQR